MEERFEESRPLGHLSVIKYKFTKGVTLERAKETWAGGHYILEFYC
jgi:hypothetical protein